MIVAGGVGNVLLHLYNRTQFLAGLNYLASGPLVLFAVAISRFVMKPRGHAFTNSLFLGTSILLTLLTGTKANIALELGAIAVVFHYRIKAIAAGVLIVLVAAAVVALTFYNLYFRDALPRGVTIQNTISESGGLAGISQSFVGNTFFGAQALGVAHDRFQFPTSESFGPVYTPLLTAAIPRGLIADKPVSFSDTFTRSFAPELASAGTTYPATGLGEFYVTGGVVGTLVGSLLLGAFLGFTYSRKNVSAFGLARYAIVLPLVPHFIRGEAFGIVVLGTTLLVPAWLILRSSEFSPIGPERQ